jgi:diguanylate cyclase
MSTTALYISAGTLLGLVQLAIGVVIGLWLRRGGRAGETCGQLDEKRARELIGQLTGLTSGLSQDVQGHQAHIAQINDRLAATGSAPTSSLSEIVVGVVSEVLRANGDLQRRLSSAEAQLQQQSRDLASYLTRALTDELTGLPNRRAFDDQLRQRLDGYNRHQVPFSLMLVDVDYFKSVNDSHGHVAGDRVLGTIAQALRAAMRKHDVVARYGGEEFAVLLPYTSLDGAAHAARHARSAVQAAVTIFEGATIGVTASVGLSTAREHDNTTTIVKRADDALYASKSGGRNCGHAHNGVTCVRILEDTSECDFGEKIEGRARRRAGASFKAVQSVSPELASACAELRDWAAQDDRPPTRSASEDLKENCKL